MQNQYFISNRKLVLFSLYSMLARIETDNAALGSTDFWLVTQLSSNVLKVTSSECARYWVCLIFCWKNSNHGVPFCRRIDRWKLILFNVSNRIWRIKDVFIEFLSLVCPSYLEEWFRFLIYRFFIDISTVSICMDEHEKSIRDQIQ